jgi:hypothetical protein
MPFENFAKFLKKKGKKEHVVRGLVDYVVEFEKYVKRKNVRLDSATVKLLKEYFDEVQSDPNTNVKNRIRAIGLYYRFAGHPELADFAAETREQHISKTKTSVALKEFIGLDPKYVQALVESGIRNADQMLARGASPSHRKVLSKELNIPLRIITEIVKLSDLSRLRGVKGVRARLYYDAGYDTLDKLAVCDPERLRKELEDFVKKTKFDGIAPLPKEVVSTIERAKKLQRIVKY